MNSTSAALSIRVFGGFELARHGQPLAGVSYEKGRAILAYLAVESERAHSRQKLAHFFWPDLPLETARTNLRQVLLNLRQALDGDEPACLIADHQTIRFNPECSHWLDAAEFSALIPACTALPHSAACNACFEKMERGAGIYRGYFLEGLSFEGAPDFEDWLCAKRETYHRHALGLLERLGDCHEHNGDPARALQFANRHLELEPWDEDGQRRVMRLLASSGQTAAALAQFESCKRMLRKELGAAPEAETVALFERIKAGELQAGPAAKPSAVNAPAERRLVTALYCGCSMHGIRDVEEISECWLEFQASISEVIHRFGGYIAQTHGGAILGYFGYPAAQEDAARKAVRAALALQGLSDAHLQVRMGLNTGMVVSGAGLPDTMGLTSALAIRLRDAQHPVVISEATRRLVAGYFKLEPVASQQIEGTPAYRVIGESGAAHRLEAAEQLTPFVGREHEIRALMETWQQARQGASRIVLVRGEAGIGKSRLIQTFKNRLPGDSLVLRELRCFPEFSQSPFHPLIAMIEAVCAFAPGDTADTKLDKLARHLQAHYPQAGQEAVSLLAQLLSLPGGAPSALPPGKQKEKLVAILLDLLQMMAGRQAVLYLIEDLHWMDPSSLELLTLFAARQDRGAILAVLTARPEFAPPWEHGSTLELPALAADEVAAMIAFVGKDIPQESMRRIVTRSDGIPLYAEEMAKLAQEGQETIPATLHDLLAAKLDALKAAKRTAQLAATIGREFDLELLRAISSVPPHELEGQLDELRHAGLLLPGNGPSHQFKHALIQEAAYQSQARPERQAAHRKIAHALQTRFPAVTENRPEILARHFAAGGETATAIEYWIKAGKRASQQSANAEAIAHFSAGLSLIPLLPPGPHRDRLEFALQVGLGIAQHGAQGYGSAQASAAFSRAMELCGQVASPDVFQTIWGIWVSRLDHFPSALEFAQKLPGLAQQLDAPALLVQAHYMLGNNLFFLGEFEAARAHSRTAVSLYRPAHHKELAERFGADSAVTGGIFLSASHWFMGFPEQAQKASADLLALARQTAHPNTLGFALSAAATLNRRMRKSAETLALAEETLALAQKHNLPLWLAMGLMLRGWALVMQGQAQGAVLVQQSIAAMRASMHSISIIFLSTLADVYLHQKQYAAALDVILESLEAMAKTGDRHYAAELYRLKGECLLGLGAANRAEALACFDQALEISRRQQAKSLELRAAMSIARHTGATELLTAVHAWFSEGFDTPDLIEARAMLKASAR